MDLYNEMFFAAMEKAMDKMFENVEKEKIQEICEGMQKILFSKAQEYDLHTPDVLCLAFLFFDTIYTSMLGVLFPEEYPEFRKKVITVDDMEQLNKEITAIENGEF